MNLNEKFEAKQQELARVEQRAAFLQSQLQEASRAREQLIGQLALLQELAQEAGAAEEAPKADADTAERAAPPPAPARTPRGRQRAREA